MRPAGSQRHLYAGVVLAAIATAGCSSMSKNECLALDWRTIGYEDGVGGYPGDHIAEYRKACGKHGVRADLALYQEGRQQGLREYCQPARGYDSGESGAGYAGVCPADLEPAFLAAFESGHQLYVLRARVRNTEAQLRARRGELYQVEHGVVSSAAAVVSGDSTNEDRAHAVLDTTKLAERVGRLKEEIRELEAEKVRHERDLDAYLATLPR